MRIFTVNYAIASQIVLIYSCFSEADSIDEHDDSDSFDQLIHLETTTSFQKPTRRPLNYCNWLQFVNRSSWEADDTDHDMPTMELPVDKIFIDYTYSERCSSLYLCSFHLKLTQAYHKKEIGLFDIAYNFMIGDDAKVYVGRNFYQARAFDDDYNNNSLLLGIIGDYEDPYGALPRTLDTLYKLIRCGQTKGLIKQNITIYEPVADYCHKGPGKRFYNYISSDRKRSVNYKCLVDNQRKFAPQILRNGIRTFSADYGLETRDNNNL